MHRSILGINVGQNDVSGHISPSIGVLTRLTTLILNRNRLVGDIPESVFGVPTLRSLDLHGNKLTGACEGCFTRLTLLPFDVLFQALTDG